MGNVPLTCDKKRIKRLFRSYGSVESVRLRSVAIANKKMTRKGGVIAKAFDTARRETANAYVVMSSAESVEAALKMNGTVVDGKTLRVDRVRGLCPAPHTRDPALPDSPPGIRLDLPTSALSSGDQPSLGPHGASR